MFLNLIDFTVYLEVNNIRKRKALFMTLRLYTFLLWFYLVLRIVVDQVPLNDLFLNSVPYFTFLRLGVIAFVFSMLFMLLYLISD